MSNATIRYLRRVNLGNFNHEELDITIGADQNVADLEGKVLEIKQFVLNVLVSTKQVQLKEEKVEVKIAEEHIIKETPKKEEVKKAPVDEVPPVIEEEAKKPAKEKTKSKAVEKKVEEAPKKVAKVTTIAYDRENKDLRSTLTTFLTKLHGGDKSWAKREDAKEISISLVGEAFMDTEGHILESFANLCKEKFGIEEDAL